MIKISVVLLQKVIAGLIETDSYFKQAEAKLHILFSGHRSLNHEQEQKKSKNGCVD